jgi:hypothetical protein
LSIVDLSLQWTDGATRHDGKARDQYLGKQWPLTDTKPRTGIGVSDNNKHQRQH